MFLNEKYNKLYWNKKYNAQSGVNLPWVIFCVSGTENQLSGLFTQDLKDSARVTGKKRDESSEHCWQF